MADIDITGVYDSITVAEEATILISGPDLNVSVYDSVTVVSGPVQFNYHLYVDPRISHQPKWPTWRLDGEVTVPSAMVGESPVWWIWATGGWVGPQTPAEGRMPIWILEGRCLENIYTRLIRQIPVWTGSGQTGSISESIVPFWEIVVSMQGTYNFASLYAYMPGWTIEASMLIEVSLSLDKRIPLWRLTGNVSISGETYLSKKTPVWQLYALSMPGALAWADGYIPLWELEASMFSGNWTLESYIPIWMMDAIGSGDDQGGGEEPGTITDYSRFTDYILRYRRP